MAAQGTAVKPADIDNAFAGNQAEIYANQPFYGALFRVQNGQEVYLQFIPQKDRLTLTDFLEQRNITQGQFLLKMNGENGQPKEIPIMVDKNAESEVPNPFFQNMPQNMGQQSGGMSKALKDEYEAQILSLRGKVTDLTDDLIAAKRKLGDDNTETALAHERELSRLKETHRDKVDELKEELSDKKMELRLKELEIKQENGGQSGWEKVLDKFLNDDTISNITQQLGELMKQQGNNRPTQAQLQQAMQQSAQAGNTGQQGNEARNNPAQSAQPQPESPQPQPQPTQEQVKQQFVDGLKNAAIEALTANNTKLNEYAKAVRSQMALLKQQGITIDAAQWVQLAKILGQQAIDKEITADRVAVVLNPLLENLPMTAKMALKTISPQAAADMLFKMYSVEVKPTVKSLVVKVLTVLKKAK